MTKDKIKEMYKSLANGDEWECKCNGYNTCSQYEIGICPDESWRPYKLGEAIHENFEYRKVEKWYVYLEPNGSFLLDKCRIGKTIFDKTMFEGTKKECEKWVEEHTKIWLKESSKKFAKHNVTLYFARLDGQAPDDENKLVQVYGDICSEVCKKILEKIEEKLPFYIDTGRSYLLKDIKSIIEDLGVKL